MSNTPNSTPDSTPKDKKPKKPQPDWSPLTLRNYYRGLLEEGVVKINGPAHSRMKYFEGELLRGKIYKSKNTLKNTKSRINL